MTPKEYRHGFAWIAKMDENGSRDRLSIPRPIIDRSLNDMTLREQRAFLIAGRLGAIQRVKRGWEVTSEKNTKTMYRVNDALTSCSCPDEFPICKHLAAINYFCSHITTLLNRLLLGDSWEVVTSLFSEDLIEAVLEVEHAYIEQLSKAASYVPPTGPLVAFKLECVGDHLWHQRLDKSLLVHQWVARILGLDPQYEFAREFQKCKKDYRDSDKYGAKGVCSYFTLLPGLYEIQETPFGPLGLVTRRKFAKTCGAKLVEITKAGVLECLLEKQS